MNTTAILYVKLVHHTKTNVKIVVVVVVMATEISNAMVEI